MFFRPWWYSRRWWSKDLPVWPMYIGAGSFGTWDAVHDSIQHHNGAGPYGGGVRWVRTNPPPVPVANKNPNLTILRQSKTLSRDQNWKRHLNVLKFRRMHYTHRTVLHFVMTSLGSCDLAATMNRQQPST